MYCKETQYEIRNTQMFTLRAGEMKSSPFTHLLFSSGNVVDKI